MDLIINIVVELTVLFAYYSVCYLFLKLVRRQYNLKWKALALILPLNLILLEVFTGMDKNNRLDFNHPLFGDFIGIFIFLYIWFIPHILTLIGLIGWLNQVSKK